MKTITATLVALAAISSPAIANEYSIFDDYITPQSAVNWDGFYAGFFGGFSARDTTVYPTAVPLSGGTLGVRAGYNIQVDSFVIGAVGSTALGAINGSATCTAPGVTSCQGGVKGTARLEARAGYAVGNTLLYAKAGGAYAYAHADSDPTYDDYYFNLFGWSVGAGVEAMITPNLSVFAEYTFSDFARHDVAAGRLATTAVHFDVNTHLAEIGMNAHF